MADDGRRPSAARRLIDHLVTLPGRVYRASLIRGRFAVVALWLVAAVVVNLVAPPRGPATDFGNLLPADAPVLQVAQRGAEIFEVPVITGTTVVLHESEGLTRLTRADALLWALTTTQQAQEDPPPEEPGQILAAIPVPTGTASTSVTYLFFSDGTGMTQASVVAGQYASHFNNQPVARTYITGFVPAQAAQTHYLESRLHYFELASMLLILIVVALVFRSLLAPLTVLGIAGVGYAVYFPLLHTLAGRLGFSVPSQLEPVLLALLLGVVTDYCVLFYHDLREELNAGHHRFEAVDLALRRTAGVVAVAGLTVAGGTIALVAAPFEMFRGLGPALALTVLVGVTVCLTLTPAVMAILGGRLFNPLPWGLAPAKRALPTADENDLPPRQVRWLEAITRPRAALVCTTVITAAMVLASLPLIGAKLDLSFTAALPQTDPVARGAQILQDAGLRGISSPTEVIVEQPRIGEQRTALADLQRLLAQQRGVVRVLGPADSRLENGRGIVVSRDLGAARFLVMFGSDPLAAEAVENARELRRSMPALMERSGLQDATVSMTGQTLIASEVSRLTSESLKVTLVVALVIELLILTLYLRAVWTALALLAFSALSVAATLGLTTLVFQGILGHQGLTFYAPFASAILLIALGSDYNVFVIGSIWGEARRRPLREAMLVAVPRSAQAITTAGLILAATFALVAIIPLGTFHQIAFTMAVGLLIDTLVIRPLLTPAVITLLGRHAMWPGKRRDVVGGSRG